MLSLQVDDVNTRSFIRIPITGGAPPGPNRKIEYEKFIEGWRDSTMCSLLSILLKTK
jgi:hypothetical protein